MVWKPCLNHWKVYKTLCARGLYSVHARTLSSELVSLDKTGTSSSPSESIEFTSTQYVRPDRRIYRTQTCGNFSLGQTDRNKKVGVTAHFQAPDVTGTTINQKEDFFFFIIGLYIFSLKKCSLADI